MADARVITETSAAAAFARRMRPAAAALEPYTAASVDRYLTVGLERPVYTGPLHGDAYVNDDGEIVIQGTVREADWAPLRAWIDKVHGLEDAAC